MKRVLELQTMQAKNYESAAASNLSVSCKKESTISVFWCVIK
ncbi:class III lanthipeptide [Clostridium sp. E02]|nr:class III lanthipeptide [Clostridium sp. E02]